MVIEWKNVKGQSKYKVSNTGHLLNTHTQVIRKPKLRNNGYYEYSFGSPLFRVKAHRLVAIHFIDNPDQLATVNHRNGNKLDNRAVNLEWMSNEDNVKHGHKNGLIQHHGIKNSQAKLSEGEVQEMIQMRRSGMRAKELSKIFNISAGHVYNICNGYYWKNKSRMGV